MEPAGSAADGGSIAAATGRDIPSVWRLFLVCFKIGSFSFGGGLSGWLFREFVSKTNWISEDDFLSTMTIAQILPGANVVNLVVCFGEQLRGPSGAVACLFGFLLTPLVSVIGLYELLNHIPPSPHLDAFMLGIAFTALGLMIQVMWTGVRRASRSLPKLAVVAVVPLGVIGGHLSIILVVLLVAPVSIWLARSQADG